MVRRKQRDHFVLIVLAVAVVVAGISAISFLYESPGSMTELISMSSKAGYDAAQTSAKVGQCKDGDAKACFDVAVTYQNGTGAPRDGAKAADYFALACDLGFAGGCAGAAQLTADANEMTQFLKKGCGLNDAGSCSKLEGAMGSAKDPGVGNRR
jgi:hypothetical protein